MGDEITEFEIMMMNLLWFFVILCCVGCSRAQVEVSFVDTNQVVKEGDQFVVRLQAKGTLTAELVAIVSVQSDIGDDFIGDTQVAKFSPGDQGVANVTFTVRDDDIAEADELFTLYMVLAGNMAARVGEPSQSQVRILANDDAFGVFGFLGTSPVEVQEKTYTSIVELKIGRTKGTFGEVILNFVVNSSNSESAEDDLFPGSGIVRFLPTETESILQLQIKADDIPENAEHFTVILTDSSPTATIDRSKIELIIQPNDAPIRFSNSVYRFEEGPGKQTVSIPVYRGKTDDGKSQIGSLDGDVVVQYTFTDRTARNGLDFTAYNGQLLFRRGETDKIITFDINDDNYPEMEESFILSFTQITGDAVWVMPNSATIIISANDNPNGIITFRAQDFTSGKPVVQVNEDTFSIARFPVARNGGTFGVVTVQWEIVRNSSSLDPVTQDVGPEQGSIMFQDGVNKKDIVVTIVQDNDPEIAEQFIVRLVSASAKASLEGITEAVLLIEDSDNVYGFVEFSTSQNQKIITTTDPRSFQLQLSRQSGRTANLVMNITLIYVTSLGVQDTDNVLEQSQIEVVMNENENLATTNVALLQTAFLHIGSYFKAMLTSVVLETEPEYGFYNTPKLNARTQVTVPVTAAEANGEIGFYNISGIIVDEPETGILQVPLRLSREGYSETANIKWILSGYYASAAAVTMDDVMQMSGTVILSSGISEIDLIIYVKADNIPELDEVMTITLVSVTPLNTQRLRPGATVANITVRANDNPAGVFQFLPSMRIQYAIKENSESLTVTVVRTGGNLLMKEVQYKVVPDGDKEFYGGTNVLRFEPGVSSMSATLLARGDGIPEIDEDFSLLLVPFGDDDPAVIGEKNNITITVLANDDPYGIIQFKLDPTIVYIAESTETKKHTVDIQVERHRGTFGTVSVIWTLSRGAEADLTPTTGKLTFYQGESQKAITLESKQDDIPEIDERYKVELSPPFGGARSGLPRMATVIIKENDNPIEFTTNLVYAHEPETVVLTIKRRGMLYKSAYVHYRTLDGSASSLTGDYQEIADTQMTFGTQKDTKTIAVSILNDDLPEGNETFSVQLFDTGGDFIFNNNSKVTIVILSNDDAYGVFHFADPLQKEAEEGNTIYFDAKDLPDEVRVNGIQLYMLSAKDLPDEVRVNGIQLYMLSAKDLPDEVRVNGIQLYMLSAKDLPDEVRVNGIQLIMRDRGTYGEMDLSWEVRDFLTNRPVPERTEFAKSSGVIRFKPRIGKYPLAIRPLPDNVPESDKRYKIVLTGIKVVVGRTDVVLGRLDTTKTEASLLVKASDEPYGRFAFPPNSREKSIAEDFVPGQEETTKATFTVERWQGSIGRVEVLWDTFSDRMGGNPPKLIDLMFVGIRPASLTTVPTKRRPSTGTNVYLFTGSPRDYITVPSQNQPSANDIRSGFSLSAWLQPMTSSNGYIIAKTNGDTYHSYSLKLTTTPFQTTFQLTFSTAEQENHVIPFSVTKNIQDGGWHHVLVSVVNATMNAYLDGKSIFTSNLVGNYVEDVSGELLVGANARGTDRFTGYMQDVRIFLRSLEQKEVEELYQTPAKEDISPTSGILVYNQGDKVQSFTVHSLQDIEEEGNEVFSIGIVSVNNGASISEADAFAALTVLKSDNANGLFGFQTPCTPSRTSNEADNITCVVARQRGDDDTVRVTWVIEKFTTAGYETATQDFLDYTGTLVFSPGERTKTLQFQIKDDDIPEVAETFRVLLSSAASDDGVTGTTNTSGASIDPRAQESRLVIEDTDYPHGLLQFTNAVTPPKPSDPMIRPADTPVKIRSSEEAGIVPLYIICIHYFRSMPVRRIRASEEAGIVSLLVVRAQGLLGQVSVEWRTEDGTAKSEGRKIPPDYVGAASSLVFADGQRFAFINITLINNNIPEPDKTFTVQLANPRFGAAVGLGSRATITIDASDGAYGIYQFAESALNTSAQETGDVGYNPAKIEVVRLGGTIGKAQVTWQVVGDDGNDVVDLTGNITFMSGQTIGYAEIRIRGDTEPELDEIVSVVLTATTEGELGPAAKLTSTVTIQANDDPYGIFVIPNTQRPVTVEERTADTMITVQRLYGKYGTVDVSYNTLLPDRSYNFLPSPVKWANSTTDFKPAKGTIRFLPNQEYVSFPVSILDDVEPEQAESIFVALTNVNLIQGSQDRPVTGSPRLGFASENYAQIIIVMNDDASGVIELSASAVETEESNPVLNLRVIRKGGAYGEVTVVFRTIDSNGQAQSMLDYVVTSTEIILSDGETSKQIPISIIDDAIPELRETFVVELLDQIVGGATLGANRRATVTILPSDDPNGAFEFATTDMSVQEPEGSQPYSVNITNTMCWEFATTDMSVQEPEGSQPYSVNITVVRKGGSMGVVTLNWEARLKGELATEDINPTSGILHFVSNEGSRRITVAILPDNIPEGQENIEFVLTGVDNGGRIGKKNKFILIIAPNDNPHGILMFANSTFTVQENPGNLPQYIQVDRQGGTYGKLRVYFSTNQIPLASLATGNGGTAVGYYGSVIQGKRSRSAGTVVDIASQTNKAEACAAECLNSLSCRSFVLTSIVNGMTCTMFPRAFSPGDLESDVNSQYYAKDMEKTNNLKKNRATSGQDFETVNEGSFLMDDGASKGSLPLVILDDSTPEVKEKFLVTLKRVVVDDPAIATSQKPQLGDVVTATVTIASSDSANGMFRIVSNSPSASGDMVLVEEKNQLAVDLVVERTGGTIGEVSVDWAVSGTQGATYGLDFIADGATLTFAAGQSRRVITVTVLDDTKPEDNETITIQLSNPQGGATIGPNSNLTVVILENDNVAGVLAFDSTAYLANEGDKLSIRVTRTAPAHGQVTVDWRIAGVRGTDPTTGFRESSGMFIFFPGELFKLIGLEVLLDDTPEVNEEYQIVLQNVTTSGIGSTGAAVVNPQKGTALITIGGSDNPHGVIQFAVASTSVRVEEDVGRVSLQVDRKFGAIGTVRVSYIMTRGSITALSRDILQEALPGSDFIVNNGHIDLVGGQSSGAISVDIVNDDLPEIDEVFLVKLTQVELIGLGDKDLPPRLASSGVIAEIIIGANDGAKGVFVFRSDSRRMTVNEMNINISLGIIREGGLYGNVSVFYYAQGITEGAVLGTDYSVQPTELLFAAGERHKDIVVRIIDDEIPEGNETFEIILTNPRNGAELGKESKAQITISANDDSGGFVSFDSSNEIILYESDKGDDSRSKAALTLTRGPGVYGAVSVEFVIIASDDAPVTDLTPSTGTVTIGNGQSTGVLEITVVDDDIPEDIETFSIILRRPVGCQLGQIKRRVITVGSSDSPNGMFEIFVANTRNSSISVEESVGLIKFDVVRSKGSSKQVTIDVVMVTESVPVSPGKKELTLATLQNLPGKKVSAWHSMEVNGVTYLLMLTSLPANTSLKSITPNNLDGNGQSLMLRWQGEITLIQTVNTNGASAADSISLGGADYLVIANGGTEGSRNVNSVLYTIKAGGMLKEKQTFSTKGASDVKFFSQNAQSFLLFVNSLDDTSKSDLSLDIYIWEGGLSRFSSSTWQTITSLYPRAVVLFHIDNVLFMAVANYYDWTTSAYETSSIIYKLEANYFFSQHQRISTTGAVDVQHLSIGDLHLVVYGNNRQNVISSPQTSQIYRWDPTTQLFLLYQEIPTNRVQAVHTFTHASGAVYLVFANGIGKSEIFEWNVEKKRFLLVWSGDPALQLYPITIRQASGDLNLLAAADVNPDRNPTVYQVAKVSKSNIFMPRTLTLTFDPDQMMLQASAYVFQDDIPEDTQTFKVALSNSSGGAEIGQSGAVTVSVLSNDNAHGIIEFAPDSLNVLAEELVGRDNTIQLNVLRQKGYFGRVVVSWVASGDNDGFNDITPVSGRVEFANGQAVSTISLTIRDDDVAEFAEVTFIQLVEVIEKGTDLPGRGAVIGTNAASKVTVLANDSPHGVVSWEKALVSTKEPIGTDLPVTLYIVREQGGKGQLQISFVTSRAVGLPSHQQATSGEDYVSRQGTVIMEDSATRTPVEIVIKHDDIPEATESFFVNITDVEVTGNPSNNSAKPSVRIPGNVAKIQIEENDNARGLVQFNVKTNTEGRFDTYEQYGYNQTIHLPISRSVGLFGSITITWQAEPVDANILDFFPSSGTVTMASGQKDAEIAITIIDDTQQENMETFKVKLISVNGGASLGPASSVTVAILKNDSPTGLFQFKTQKVVTKESTSPTDPQGRATLIVERIQGSEGLVHVQWRLNAEARTDFLDPLYGTLQFRQGELEQSITVQTKPDSTLEGEETFTVSLTSADNNADISPTKRDATIVILPNSGASGLVSVEEDSRLVYIGEPGESSPSYKGEAQIVISRGAGIFGDISVTWSITPYEQQAFLQLEGTVRFVDLQQKATIVIAAKDDTVPELRKMYTLQINSAAGGATVTPDPLATRANIIFVASDFPHGRFEFGGSQMISTGEDSSAVTVEVVRRDGSSGQVRVQYTTTSGTAIANEDFFETAGTLMFENGMNSQNIGVTIRPDDKPEGAEYFYVNLTAVELVYPTTNDYTKHNGLQLDMRPALGAAVTKVVVITQNDNAAGIIEFDEAAKQFVVKEEEGMARVPVIRRGGNYGQVGVKFSIQPLTATVDDDFIGSSGELIIADGRRTETINVTIKDDTEMEFAETFKITLLEATGGALLGGSRTSTVTIAKSDFPNGQFGFLGQLDLVMANPSNAVTQMFAIQRTGGLLGQQTVYWRIMGPNNPAIVLEDTGDLSYNNNGVEVTSGTLVWADSEAGQKKFVINIKPYSSWEIEKHFILEIFKIEANPLSAEAGEVSETRGKVTLKIQKFGDPNGIVQFNMAAQTVREVEEPNSGTLDLVFPITRKAGTGIVGNIQIFWEVRGPTGLAPDVQPQNGSTFLANERRSGQITLKILSDDVPELTESFTLAMTRVKGGAELDTEFRSSSFKIRYNDNPHGMFGVRSEDQSIVVDPADLTRRIQLNFTRHDGAFGSTILTYTVNYNKPLSGIILKKNTGTVQFNQGNTNSIKMVDIQGNGFLELGSTFMVSLQGVQYLGNGVTEPPRLKAGETEALIPVPALAANSKVGFKDTVVSVNEDSNMVTLDLIRFGTYGSINVDWISGVEDTKLPSGVRNGIITPTLGTVSMPHGVETKQFTVQVNPKSNQLEKFTIRLPGSPKTSVNGGTQLLVDQKEADIEPYGLVQFAAESLKPTVSELKDKVLLTVIRLYGSVSKLEIRYETEADTAQADLDFKDIKSGLISMNPGQMTATISVQIFQDNQPETGEKFKVKLLGVEKFPTSAQPSVSPRLSSRYAVSTVTIKESNDPNGILSIEPTTTSVAEEYTRVVLKVVRTGGPIGIVSVRVRTVGGGESWTSTIVPNTGVLSNDTISDIMGQKNKLNIATGGRDYEVLDTTITFQPNENEKPVSVTILDDNIPEGAMSVIVYLTEPQGGARVAEGTPDAGKKGYSVITIQPSDLSNGLIGFSDDSKSVTANEDQSPVITLTLNRLNSFIGEVQVYWKAKKSKTSTNQEDVELPHQLVATTGVATCPAKQSTCSLTVELVNDQEPEEGWIFVIKLLRAEVDAKINENNQFAVINVEPSDYIRGLLQFTTDSRTMVVGENAKSVRLMVERVKGQGYDVEVLYNTLQMTSQTTVSGLKIYPALEGSDFTRQTGKLVFQQNTQGVQFIDLTLTPVLASNNPLPKQFSVLLKNPTNGASIHPEFARAHVRIVKNEYLLLWKAIVEQQTAPLTNVNIQKTVNQFEEIVKDDLDDNDVTLIENTLKRIINEGKKRKLPPEVFKSVVSLFCKLLDPGKNDATQGRSSLALILEEFAYTFLTNAECPTPNPPDVVSQQCTHVKVSAGRWPMENIEGFNYAAQRQDKLVLPATIPQTSTGANGCHDFHMIEYNSDQWFRTEGGQQLLSGRVISFGIKGRQSGYIDTPIMFRIHSPDRRVATRRAQCVYFDMAIKQWVGPEKICQVTNNLELGTDDFVDCSCNHMTSYAIVAKTSEVGLVGYTLWFYIACFICIGCMFVTILVHHACVTRATISACLIMHMCFAAMATQVCLVVAAYLSPSEILVYNNTDDNYRCIVMGIFMHYFFLTQFTWIVTQSYNFWKLLVMNDEHTDRKYVIFFVLGWGLPLLLVAVFYAIVYNVYKFVYDLPVAFIYGDVNNNSEMCFITNAYSVLGGIIIPVLLMLTVTGVIFVKAFQILPGWQAYDDIYRGRYNYNEVRLTLLFWLVIILTWLWGGLHMVYGQLWMLILFCIFNILQGLLALILYGIIRNPLLACVFGPKNASYAVSSDFDNFFPTTSNNFHFQASQGSNDTPKGSRASLLNESWERDSVGQHSQMTVKRALPSQVYIDPPVAYITPPSHNDVDDKDFDEILYALKAGGSFAPSEVSHNVDDDNLSELSVRLEGFQTKKIEITDTHL
ncbi:adhesion G-protein coupled receptor V1-like [Gigantopelta aegis]|uniref:adhesion G-protein coupled receptor V1-like n=1 Tax=Gigantopelta aegis TaxID=1735272 RepID=UPI001B88776E|nr:adhesion G-protein coupled receptor V1-like [Gigantopelta aegis]